LGYSYSVAGTCYSGQYKQEFPTDKEAQDFIRDLQDQQITVHYNPNSPGSSTLLASDIDVVLQHRAPSPEGESPLPAESIPDWLRPFIWIFIALSALGLVVSVWVHLAGVMGKRAAPMPFFFLLHVGIFVVFIPALLISQRQVGNVNRKDFWKVVPKSSPDWMRYMVYFLFAYAAVNFLLYMTKVGFGHAGDPTAQDWRGFSGHWMVFYSASLAILYSAAREWRMFLGA